MDKVLKGPPPSITVQHSQKTTNDGNENNIGLFEYKEKFDSSYLGVGRERPNMGSRSWNEQSETEYSGMQNFDTISLSKKPLINLLHIPGVQERSILTRFFYYSYITTTRNTQHFYPSIYNMKKTVLSGEKLHHAIQTTIHSDKASNSKTDSIENDRRLERELQHRATSILDEMLATVTSKALKFCGWLFLTLLRQLTSAIHLHEGQLEVIRTLSKGDKPLVYFPLHFSHFDYILLSLVLYHNEVRSPFVASGNNLLIQPFSYIMRRVGGFFIRRKIDNGLDKDLVYRAVLHSYVTELLRNGQSLEIFIEGTRSRSGLPNHPKTGLLSIAVEALERGDVEDIIVVPVCISYEKLLEGSFYSELMGQNKTPETLLFSIMSITKMLCGFYGHIRINFGNPQSLKKILHELRTHPSCSSYTNATTISRTRSLYDQVTPVENDSFDQSTVKKTVSFPSVETNCIDINARQHLHKMATPISSPLLSHCNAAEDNQTRELVTLLGERIIYSSLKCKAFMSTNIVAFLLMHQWRNGVTMSVLVDSFRHLVTEILTRKSDVGFSGDFYVVVLHAINYLGSHLIHLDCTFAGKMRRNSSSASLPSGNSTDSGYDLDEVVVTPTKSIVKSLSSEGEGSETYQKSFAKSLPSSEGIKTETCEKPVPKPLIASESEGIEVCEKSTCSSDSGGEMSPFEAEPEEPQTGLYMSTSESGVYAFDRTPAPSGRSSKPMSPFRSVSSKRRSDVCLFVKPELNIPQVFELAYYSNALTPMFALESIVALAVGATTNFRFSTLEKQLTILQDDSPGTPVRLDTSDLPESVTKSFLRSTLLDKTLELVDILQMDLILCDVTTNLDDAVNAALEMLISSSYLTSQEYGVSVVTRQSQTNYQFDFDDSEAIQDQWLKVNISSVPNFIAMQSVMACFVEGYVAAATKLGYMLESPRTETVIREAMLTYAQDRVHSGLAVRSESSSSDVIRNALRSFEWNGIITRCHSDKNVLQLSEDFADAESIANLVSRISQFLL